MPVTKKKKKKKDGITLCSFWRVITRSWPCMAKAYLVFIYSPRSEIFLAKLMQDVQLLEKQSENLIKQRYEL